MMSAVFFPLLLFFTWCLLCAGSLVDKRYENIKSRIPKDKWGGVSIFPIIPIFPLFFWGAAYGVDYFFAPWGMRTVAGLHALLSLFCIGRMIVVSRKTAALEKNTVLKDEPAPPPPA